MKKPLLFLIGLVAFIATFIHHLIIKANLTNNPDILFYVTFNNVNAFSKLAALFTLAGLVFILTTKGTGYRETAISLIAALILSGLLNNYGYLTEDQIVFNSLLSEKTYSYDDIQSVNVGWHTASFGSRRKSRPAHIKYQIEFKNGKTIDLGDSSDANEKLDKIETLRKSYHIPKTISNSPEQSVIDGFNEPRKTIYNEVYTID